MTRARTSHARPGTALVFAVFVILLGCITPAHTTAAASTPPVCDAVALHLDASHSGSSCSTLPASPKQRWSVTLKGKSSYPIIVGGRVFVATGTGTTDYGGWLYALDQKTGANLWGPIPLGGIYNWYSLAFDSATLFVADSGGTVTAYDPSTGAQRWAATPSVSSGELTAYNGVLYLQSLSSVYAVDESTGATLWTSPSLNGNSSTLAVNDLGVFIQTGCARYRLALDTGEIVWSGNTGCDAGGSLRSYLSEGRLFGGSDNNGLVFDQLTGATLGTTVGLPAFAGQVGYFVHGDLLDVVNTSTLATINSYGLPEQATSSPVVVGNTVYVAGAAKLYGIDPSNGHTVWSSPLPTGTTVGSGPTPDIAVGDDLLVAPSGNALTAFGSDVTPPTVNITSKPPTVSNSNTATFAFTGSDPDDATSTLTYTCSLDNAAATPCHSPATFSGLAVGTHSFTIWAHDPEGNASQPSTYSWQLGTARFTAVPTTRLVAGTQLGTSPTAIQIAGRGGIPAGATAVVANVEISGQTTAGYVRLTPYGSDPQVAVQEYAPGQAISNLVTVELVEGKVQAKVSAGTAKLYFDVAGYYSTGSASTFVPLRTTRLVAGSTLTSSPLAIQVAGKQGVPADATAIVVNAEVSDQTAAGYLRLTPYGSDSQVAVQEYAKNQAISNLVTVQLAQGKIQAKVSTASARLYLDIAGYYTDTSGSTFVSTPPTRIVAGSTLTTTAKTIQVAGYAGIPANATAVVVNAEVSAPSSGGYLRVTPYGSDPQVAVQPYAKGETISNLVIVQLVQGKIQAKVSAGTATLFLDVCGYFV